MANKIRKIGILASLTGLMLIGIALMALSYSEVGVTDKILSGGLDLSGYDFSTVPQSVAEDAARLAQELYDRGSGGYQDFVNQLLVSYLEAKGEDFIVVFNPGGWGWSLVDRSTGWQSILTGIKSELESQGYESVMLNYRRTSESMRGLVKELVESVTGYPSKAKDLACRMEFLTENMPDLKVIIAGESTGSVISDYAMNILHDNPNVYSIQTGSPFWHDRVTVERTLVLNSNGKAPDTFSRGEVLTMVWASLKAMVGLAPQQEDPGRILYFLRAPGHDYRWQYPDVYSRIVGFLENNFGINRN